MQSFVSSTACELCNTIQRVDVVIEGKTYCHGCASLLLNIPIEQVSVSKKEENQNLKQLFENAQAVHQLIQESVAEQKTSNEILQKHPQSFIGSCYIEHLFQSISHYQKRLLTQLSTLKTSLEEITKQETLVHSMNLADRKTQTETYNFEWSKLSKRIVTEKSSTSDCSVSVSVPSTPSVSRETPTTIEYKEDKKDEQNKQLVSCQECHRVCLATESVQTYCQACFQKKKQKQSQVFQMVRPFLYSQTEDFASQYEEFLTFERKLNEQQQQLLGKTQNDVQFMLRYSKAISKKNQEIEQDFKQEKYIFLAKTLKTKHESLSRLHLNFHSELESLSKVL